MAAHLDGTVYTSAGGIPLTESECPGPYPIVQPMPLQRLREPFDHGDWLYELKYDGFRCATSITATAA